MKERLVELMTDCEISYAQYLSEECDKAIKGDITKQLMKRIEFYADYLIANGVIVSPCKVGQTVFRLVKLHGYGYTKIVEGTVFEVAATYEYGEIKHRFYFWEKGTTSKHINRYSLWCEFDQIGKSVFLTKEEAEAKLKERKEDE